MIDRVTTQTNIDSMLATIRQYQTDAAGKNTPAVLTREAPEVGKPTFFEAVKSAVERDNEVAMKAGAMREAYDRGEDVPLTDVVLAMQKSSISFEATLQVRNKILRSYEEIMNMPV